MLREISGKQLGKNIGKEKWGKWGWICGQETLFPLVLPGTYIKPIYNLTSEDCDAIEFETRLS